MKPTTVYVAALTLGSIACGGAPGGSAESPSSPPAGAAHTDAADAPSANEGPSNEPFELLPDDEKLTLLFEGGPPLCRGRATRAASGKYVVDFPRKTVSVTGTDACGGPFRRDAILTSHARPSLETLVLAARVPKQTASFGPTGEVAQARHAVNITRRGGHVVRLGSGALDAHEGHAPRIRAYLDTLVR